MVGAKENPIHKGACVFRRALVSVSDKSGLIEFLKPMVEHGMTIVSTGGTAKHLQAAGLVVTDVSQQTEFPEILEGRVKTLHPKIHMALLGRVERMDDMAVLKHYGVEPFDLVVGNLYPFEEALGKGAEGDELIEYIDIGGPSFLRSAAKNFKSITIVCDPKDYSWVLKTQGDLSFEQRKGLASKVFSHTASYDALIAEALGTTSSLDHALGGSLVQELRYGENPQQKANWYRKKGETNGWHKAQILQGKVLSYNNLLDLDAASNLVCEFSEPAVVAVKHNNPCGVGIGESGLEAVEKALGADPVSVFGGIVAINFPVDLKCAEKLGTIFLECIVAPSYSDEAKEFFARKKNLRILEWRQMNSASGQADVKTIAGGYLIQDRDSVDSWQETWSILGEKPQQEVRKNMELAWKVVASLKSNAIAIAGEGKTLGLGMGQVNRVEAVEHALARWQKHHANVKDVVVASDAFFPFPDSVELLAKAGVRWVIQPGGSVNDDAVFKAAKELKINMVLTGRRHFRH
jgi:phosphoribosylaminoimidazolecarboxamide formyltransferase/IMP cyclohydrolase